MKGSVSHNKRTLLLNAAWNWSGFATTVVVTFVVCPIYIRSLGDERYGIWSLVEVTVAYFALLDLGIGASIVRYVAKFEALEDRDRLNRIFSTTCAIFIAAACLTLTVSAGLAFLWERPLGVPAELSVDTRWLLFLLGCNVAVELVAGVFGAVLLGLGRFPARVTVDIVLRIAGAAVMVTVLWAGYGLLGIAIVCLAATLIKGLLLALLARHYLPDLRFSPSLIGMDTFRIIRGYSFLAFVAMIAGRISFSTDAIVIGAFLSPEYITYFVVAARLTEYAKSSVASLTSALTPAVSTLHARGNMDAIRAAFLRATRLVLWVSLPVQAGFLVLGKPFLTLWLGERYAAQSFPVLVILAISLGFSLSQATSGRILYGLGDLTWFTGNSVAMAVANLLISVLLVTKYGIEGVALGTAIPCVLANVALARHTCRRLDVRFGEYVVRAVGVPLLSIGVAVAMWLVLIWIHPITTWCAFLLTGAVGTASYAAIGCLVEVGFGSALVSHFARCAGGTGDVGNSGTTGD